MNKETAQKILKIGLETNDEELISLATMALDIEEKPAYNRESSQTKSTDDGFIFTMPSSQSEEDPNRSIPVNKVKNRVNTFVDDGVEAKDIVTPNIQPTERKRKPFKKIDQTCEKCGKVYTIHPAHKRDYFICDKCITR